MSAEFEDVMLYAERPEWEDVVPVPQYQGVDALAPINYSPECPSALCCLTPTSNSDDTN